MLGAAGFVFSIYLEIEKGKAHMSPFIFPTVLRDYVVLSVSLAAFLLLCSRSFFRNRKVLENASPTPSPPEIAANEAKPLFSFTLCVLAGLFVGAVITFVFATMYYGKLSAQALLLDENAHFMEASQRTWDAYMKEPKPVAIYALSQYLNTLQRYEQFHENPLMPSKRSLANLTVLTHGRLAKLYLGIGESNLSSQHVSEALNRARVMEHLKITNEITLTEWINKMDQFLTNGFARSRLVNTSN